MSQRQVFLRVEKGEVAIAQRMVAIIVEPEDLRIAEQRDQRGKRGEDRAHTKHQENPDRAAPAAFPNPNPSQAQDQRQTQEQKGRPDVDRD
jgi:hypothetical protein